MCSLHTQGSPLGDVNAASGLSGGASRDRDDRVGHPSQHRKSCEMNDRTHCQKEVKAGAVGLALFIRRSLLF